MELVGGEQKIDLPTGTLDPLANGGSATIDLHWNEDHSAIVGTGKIPGIAKEVEFLQELREMEKQSPNKLLVRGDSKVATEGATILYTKITIGDVSWEMVYVKGTDKDFLPADMMKTEREISNMTPYEI